MTPEEIKALKESNGRFPYTYACDHIRSIAGYGREGTKLSRSDASAILSEIARVLGMPNHEEIAIKLAIVEMNKTEEHRQRDAQRLIQVMQFGE